MYTSPLFFILFIQNHFKKLYSIRETLNERLGYSIELTNIKLVMNNFDQKKEISIIKVGSSSHFCEIGGLYKIS